MDRNRHRRRGRKCLRKRLTTSFVWLDHQLPSLLTQTMSAKSGRHIEHDYRKKRARARANKQLSKNAGKPFPSWEHRRRNRPPSLVVPTTHESTCAQYYCGQIVYVPELGDVVITEEHIMQAEMLKTTVGQLLDIEPMSPLREEEIKRKYVRANLWSSQTRSRTSQRECMNCINGT